MIKNNDTFIDQLIHSEAIIGKQLAEIRHMTFREYVKSLIPEPEFGNNNPHRLLVGKAFERQLKKWDVPQSDTICDTLMTHPVIQMADHSNLLFDQETFLNNYFFHLACREADLHTMIIWQCSMVSCITRRTPIFGPIFCRTRGECYKLFPVSNWKLTKSTLCSLPGPVKTTFDVVEGDGSGKHDSFLQIFINRIFPDAPTCYRICNNEIWDALRIESKTQRIAVDESLSAQIVADYLEDPHSPVSQLIFDEYVRDVFVSIKREMVANREFYTVNRASPDFIWYRRGSRLIPVILDGKGKAATFVLESHDQTFPVAYEPKSFIRALRNGDLYPDKILIYFVRCLFPGIRAIGGTSQQDYVAMYRELLIRTNQETNFIGASLMQGIKSATPSYLGGAPLLELNDNQKEILSHIRPDTDFTSFRQQFMDKPLHETMGNFNCAMYFKNEFEKGYRLHECSGNK